MFTSLSPLVSIDKKLISGCMARIRDWTPSETPELGMQPNGLDEMNPSTLPA
jgi:hypothetical protein